MVNVMTIEGRPFLGHDLTYAQQRKDRMGDCILDYISDEKLDARQCYEEMLDELNLNIVHHRTQMRKAVQLKEYMLGHRPIDLIDLDDGRHKLLD